MILSCSSSSVLYLYIFLCVFFFQAEDGIRDLVRSRGLGDVYKRQTLANAGAKVVINYLKNKPAADEVCAAITSAGGELSLIHI